MINSAGPIRTLAFCLLIIGQGSVLAQDYVVRHDAENQALYVRACFEPGRGLSLRAASNDARDYLLFARYGDDTRLRLSRNRMFLPSSESRRCVRYGVDLTAITEQARMRSGYAIEDSILTWSGTWLWRPRWSIEGSALRFVHDQAIAVSAPWPLVDRTPESTEYRLDATPADWSNLVAIGPFQPRTLKTPGGELRLAVLPRDDDMDERKMIRWMDATVNAVSQIYGRMPLESPQVLVAPITRGNGPVPWAQVQRGGGSAVHLFVNPEHDLQTFVDDWTASHEFSHLFHPYLGGGGRWFSEGLASYYQNVSRARAGQLDEMEAWRKLHAGFGRGRKDTDNLSLRQANRRIREGRYMRVYWTGAAIALMADVELRISSDGKQTLDTVLAEFAACHLPAQRVWRTQEMMSALDQLAGGSIFMDLYRRYSDSNRFPDVSEAYRSLGLYVRHGRLRAVSDDGDALALRTRLMGQSQANARVASCPTRDQPVS